MKLSYNLRKLLLIQTLVAVAIGGYLAWHRWDYLFDEEYWKYLELSEQLSAVPLKIGDWEGTIEIERIFPAQFDKEYRGISSSAFLHQVFQHQESGEEIILYLGAGHARTMDRWSYAIVSRHGWTEVGEYSIAHSDSAVQVSFREVLSLPDEPLEQPSIWLTAFCETGNWRLPNRFDANLAKRQLPHLDRYTLRERGFRFRSSSNRQETNRIICQIGIARN